MYYLILTVCFFFVFFFLSQQKEAFKKRWFVLDSENRKLLYFKHQLVRASVRRCLARPVGSLSVSQLQRVRMQDAEELGVIFIGTEGKGYSVRECEPTNARGNKWKCGITVGTPGRRFIFMCEEESEQSEWLQALTQVLQRPMTPQDHASKQRTTTDARRADKFFILVTKSTKNDPE